MEIEDFALLHANYSRWTPTYLRVLGFTLNVGMTLLGIAMTFAAGSFGVAFGWWAFHKWFI